MPFFKVLCDQCIPQSPMFAAGFEVYIPLGDFKDSQLRIEISCHKCTEQIAAGESGTVYSLVCSVRDDGVYELKCPEGHCTTTVLRTPKHEVLYLVGANALLDGYFRDALASFASSLERYFEFALRVVMGKKQINQDPLQATWKMMSMQSERQFGAFIAVWLMETGKPYTKLSQNKITEQANLRNKVIHQGKIPTLDECLNYGQYVIDVIAPIEQVLLADYAEAHKNECFSVARRISDLQSSPITVLSEFSVLSAALKDNAELKPSLDRLREARKRIGIPSIEAKETEIFKRSLISKNRKKSPNE